MRLGILKEEKRGEHRVICTPNEVRSITAAGHEVLVREGCGRAAGFPDAAYAAAGAQVVCGAKEVFARCELVAKVKEFTEEEFPLMREGQILLGCLHPAANPAEVNALLESGCIAFTAEDSHRYASPNCEAAGKLGALFGVESLLTVHGGKGKYVGGLAGAPAIHALILGAGTVGRNALSVLYALGARCTVMDVRLGTLQALMEQYGSRIDTALCSKEAIAALLPCVDLVLNCVRWPKERTDFLIDADMLRLMEAGSVLVDVSGDRPGAIQTARDTHLDAPRYVVNGVVHYCVANIPGAAARSASEAYGAAMLPMLLSLLGDGVVECCVKNGFYRRSLTAYRGLLTHEETSAVQGRPWMPPERALGITRRALDPAPPATVTRSTLFYEP